MFKHKNLLNLVSKDELAIDLGSANTYIILRGDNKIYSFPSLVALDNTSDDIVALGVEARDLQGRAGANARIIHPIQNGVVADLELASTMLKSFLKIVLKKIAFTNVKVMMSFPSGATEVEKTAFYDTAILAGAKEVKLLSESIATILGQGIEPTTPTAQLTVNMGSGHTQASVCSYGTLISYHLEREGGKSIDEKITRYIKLKYKLQISATTAENIKIELADIYASKHSGIASIEVKGRDIKDNLPRSIMVYSHEFKEIATEAALVVVRCLLKACESLPSQISGDIIGTNVMIAGSAAKLKGLCEFIKEQCGLDSYIVKKGATTVVLGLVKALDYYG